MCWLQNMSLLKESIPRDWEWEQEGKRTKTNRLNQVLISIFGLVWSIFRYKHLMIWFSNLGCSALRKRGFAIPTSNGEKEQGGKKTPQNHRLRSEQWLCCRTSHKLQRGLWTIHSRCKECRNWHRGRPTDTGLGWAHPIHHRAAVTHRHMHTQSQEEKRKMQVLERRWEKAECSLEH